MNLLIWNCRGLGLSRTVKEVASWCIFINLRFYSFLKLKKEQRYGAIIRVRWRFDNCLTDDCIRKSGGLAMFCLNDVCLKIESYYTNNIDSTISGDNGKLRFTGFYSYPKTSCCGMC